MKKTILLFAMFSIFTTQSQNWGEQILNQPNTATNNFFGFSVDIDDNFAIIGTPGENERTGSAHIYKKDVNGTWNYHQRIEAYVGKHDDEYFGWAVAIEGDFVFVSARTDRLNEEKFEGLAGSVMIYKKDANEVWNGIQRIRSSDIRIGDNFGYDLSVDGDYLVVGASGQDYDADNLNQETSAGAAYIFKKDVNDVWNELQKITPSHRDYSDNIGTAVSINGDYIVLASENDTDEINANPISGNGSAFVFKKDVHDVWTETQKLKPSNGVSNSHFGFNDVTISDDFIAVGAKNLDNYDNATNAWYYGAVYLFKKDVNGIWNESQIIRTPYPASNFGSGVSLDDNLLLVSAPYSRVEKNGSNIQNVGLSYLFVKNMNDEFALAETIQTSEINANSTIGEGEWDGNPSTGSIAIQNNHFIIGAPNIDDLVNNPNTYNFGKAFISGNVHELGLLNSVLNVEENNGVFTVNAYPNPVENELNIQISESSDTTQITVYNLLGKILVDKKVTNSNKLLLNFPYPKGVYFLKITSRKNKTKVIKIIKNH